MIKLRDYQDRGVALLRGALRKYRSALFVGPTGCGKTVLFSYMALMASMKGKRVWIVFHRDSLLRQVSQTLNGFGVRHGFIAAGMPIDFGQAVQVCSVLTAAGRIGRVPDPDLIIVDEAHHATTGSAWGKVVNAFPRSKVVGVTATPQRLDGKGLGDCFDYMVQGPTIRELMDRYKNNPKDGGL